jgi:hypothetical protein
LQRARKSAPFRQFRQAQTRRRGPPKGELSLSRELRHDRQCGDRPRVRECRGPDIPQSNKAFLIERYLTPEPRLKLIGAMTAHANDGMDVSDGFAGDLGKMLGQRPRADL